MLKNYFKTTNLKIQNNKLYIYIEKKLNLFSI